MSMAKSRKWTDSEVAALRDNYRKRGAVWDGWQVLLPGRTAASIEHKAKSEGLSHERFWTPEQDEILRLHYQTKPKGWDGWRRLLPGKTRSQVCDRAFRLGLRSPRGGRYGGWTDSQRADLVNSVRGVSERTGHPFLGCVKELNNLRQRAARQR